MEFSWLVRCGYHPLPLSLSLPLLSSLTPQDRLSSPEQDLVRAAITGQSADLNLPLLCSAVRICLGKSFSPEPWLAARPDWTSLRSRDLLTDSPNPFDQPPPPLLTSPLQDKYKLSKKPARAGFGRIYQGKLREAKKTALTLLTSAGNDTLVAVKIVEPSNQEEEGMALREIATLASLKHPNLLLFHEAYRHGHKFSIVTEFLEGGTLQDAAGLSQSLGQTGGRLGEPELAHIAQAVLGGLRFLHEKKLLHRDIKPQNVMLSALGEVKLIDCGLVCHLADLPARRRLAGSPLHLAPEMVRGQLQGPPLDVWCTGLTISQAANSQASHNHNNLNPNPSPSPSAENPNASAANNPNPSPTNPGPTNPNQPPTTSTLLRTIFLHSLEGVPEPLHQPNFFSPQCVDFLRACLRLHPADRPSVRHCLKHAWLERACTAQDLARTVARLFLANTVQLSGL